MNLSLERLDAFKLQDNLKDYAFVALRQVGKDYDNLLPQEVQAFLKEKQSEKPLEEGLVHRYILLGNTVVPVFVLTLKEHATSRDVHKALRKLYKELESAGATRAQFMSTIPLCKAILIQILKRLELESLHFDFYKTSGVKTNLEHRDPEKFKPQDWQFYIAEIPGESSEILTQAHALAQSIFEARCLVNHPANVMTPTRLAQEAQRLGAQHGFDVEVHGKEWICQQGLEAFWNVARGSDEEPQFIIMRYMNAPQSKEILALVGKGMCYDCGGLAIKPATGMVTMQSDMGGSAAVIGAISALAATKTQVNVVAIVAACENMISGHSYRNGDIIGSYAGKFIEVLNTDAEGRLTLADAVAWAWKQEGATKIIDIATLTGAMGVALGTSTTGVLADDESLWNNLEHASKISGDKVWRLPIDEEFESQNASKRADIANIGGSMAGSITAGLFVRAFAGNTPWMHMDIAFTSWFDNEDDFSPRFGTGAGVELLYDVARLEFNPSPCGHHKA